LEKFKKVLTEGANWITITFSVILYVIIGLMRFENGSIVLEDFTTYTWMDWTLWGIVTLVPAIIALVVSTAFKREGIRQGKELIQTEIKEYQAQLHIDIKKRVRSEKEFLTVGAITEGIKKLITALLLSFVTAQLLINIDTNGALKICINVAMWIVYGATSFNKSYTYVKEELREWYIIETAKLKDANKPVAKL